MSESWDDYADGWDNNESVIAYSERAFQSLTNTLNIDGLRVLDFGCGTGLLTEKLSPHASSIVALDPSSKMLSVVNSKNLDNVDTLAAELDLKTIEENELLSQQFDLVVASSALAFVPDFRDTLKLVTQILKRDGHLVQWDWLKQEGQPGSGFSKREITDAYDQAGFSACTLSIPFSMENQGDSIDVVMAVACNGEAL